MNRRTKIILATLTALLLLLPGAYLLYRSGARAEALRAFHEAQLSMARQAGALNLSLGLYYPRFGTPWGASTRWIHWDDAAHNPDNYVNPGRRDIAAVDYPIGAPYDVRDVATRWGHVNLSLQIGLDGLAVDWWGEQSYEDTTMALLMATGHAAHAGLRFVPLYEAGAVWRVKGPDVVASDLRYLLRQYGGDDLALKVTGSPVIILRGMDALPAGAWRDIAAGLGEEGLRPFLLGDAAGEARYVLGGLVTLEPATLALGPAPLATQYASLAAEAREQGLLYLPAFSPGFDNSSVDPLHASRVARQGTVFLNATWQATAATGSAWRLLDSVNGWQEGTEVEPSLEYGSAYVTAVAALLGG